MQSMKYLPAYPIVFVMDFSNDAVKIPEYDPRHVAASNNTCVSVRTIADVDGEVTVFLADSPPSHADGLGCHVFTGDIQAPSGAVAVVTSENEKLLEHSVGKETVELQIFVDDEDHPSKVWVFAK
jgi:hypothetical protein